MEESGTSGQSADNLRGKTRKGTLWSIVERFSVQGVSFIVLLVMARLLTPDDYGIVGMIAIFIEISQSLVDSGFSQALIRKRDRSGLDNSTAFFFNIAVGALLYLILFFTAPYIASFYNKPGIDAILVPLIRLLGLSVIVNSFVVVQRALFTIKLDFKSQAKASLAAAVTSGFTGIGMAYGGCGVWAIAGQQLTNLAVNTSILWLLSDWRPRREYSWESFRKLFGFGSKMAAAGVLDTIYKNIYNIAIGKYYKTDQLGYYTRAQQFGSFLSTNVTGIIQRVTFPVLCTIQDDDERLSRLYRKFLRLAAFIIFPLMTGLAAVADPLVIVLLKQKWAFAGTLLGILCFSMMWYPIHAINLNLLQVKGRSDLFLYLEIAKKTVGAVIMIITIPMGLIAICVGQVANSLIALVINTHFTGKLIGVGFIRQLHDLLPTLFYSLSMFAAVWFVGTLFGNEWVKLAVGIPSGIIWYFGLAWVTRSTDLRELVSFIRSK